MALTVKKTFSGREIELDGVLYTSRRNTILNQWHIVKGEPINDKKRRYSIYFASYNRDTVKALINSIIETEKLPEKLPDTSQEIPPPRILWWRTKHFTYHFLVSTPELLEKTGRHILNQMKDENYVWEPTIPENNSGIKKIEDLEQIPFEQLKQETKIKFEKYQKEYSKYKSNKADWDDLQRIIDGEGTIHNVVKLLQHYVENDYDIEDLIVVK